MCRNVTTVVTYINNCWSFNICMFGFRVCNSKWNEVWNVFCDEDWSSTALQEWKNTYGNVSMFKHKMQTIILPSTELPQFHLNSITVHCMLSQYNVTRHRTDCQTTESPTLIYAVLVLKVAWATCVFWNRGREHYGTLQAATTWHWTQAHNEQEQRKHKFQTQKTPCINCF